MPRGEIGKSSNFGCGDGVKTLDCGFDSRRGNKLVITKTEEIMKEFLKIMGKDILSENFTCRDYVVYGIVAPLVLVLVCVLADSLG